MNKYKPFFHSRHFVLLVSALSLAGCQYAVHYDSYTRTKPNIVDLPGTYVLTNQTLTEQPITNLCTDKGASASTPTLIIRSNGTFVSVNIPQWSGNTGAGWSLKSFKSGSGKWSLDGGSEGGWGLTFKSTNMKLPNVNGEGTFLIGNRAPYPILFNLAEDPDFDDAMTFEKETR